MDTFALPLCDEFIKQQLLCRKWYYHFLPADRAAVDKMTTAMRDSFMGMIGENKWTSDFTKINALTKLAGMWQFVGYPDWLTKGTKLERKFEKLRPSFAIIFALYLFRIHYVNLYISRL